MEARSAGSFIRSPVAVSTSFSMSRCVRGNPSLSFSSSLLLAFTWQRSRPSEDSRPSALPPVLSPAAVWFVAWAWSGLFWRAACGSSACVFRAQAPTMSEPHRRLREAYFEKGVLHSVGAPLAPASRESGPEIVFITILTHKLMDGIIYNISLRVCAPQTDASRRSRLCDLPQTKNIIYPFVNDMPSLSSRTFSGQPRRRQSQMREP